MAKTTRALQGDVGILKGKRVEVVNELRVLRQELEHETSQAYLRLKLEALREMREMLLEMLPEMFMEIFTRVPGFVKYGNSVDEKSSMDDKSGMVDMSGNDDKKCGQDGNKLDENGSMDDKSGKNDDMVGEKVEDAFEKGIDEEGGEKDDDKCSYDDNKGGRGGDSLDEKGSTNDKSGMVDKSGNDDKNGGKDGNKLDENCSKAGKSEKRGGMDDKSVKDNKEGDKAYDIYDKKGDMDDMSGKKEVKGGKDDNEPDENRDEEVQSVSKKRLQSAAEASKQAARFRLRSLNCPCGRKLQRQVARCAGEWVCDMCEQLVPVRVAFGLCRRCDWAACGNCLQSLEDQAAAVTKATEAAAKPVKASAEDVKFVLRADAPEFVPAQGHYDMEEERLVARMTRIMGKRAGLAEYDDDGSDISDFSEAMREVANDLKEFRERERRG